jgi:hypothetical protein
MILKKRPFCGVAEDLRQREWQNWEAEIGCKIMGKWASWTIKLPMGKHKFDGNKYFLLGDI